MIYTINNCIRAFGYTNFDKLIADMGSVDNLKAYVRANGYADIAVAEDTELLLVDVNGKTWHTGCYGAKLEPGPGPDPGPEPEPEPEKPYLCFTSTGNSTISMKQTGTPNKSANKIIQYKLNDGQWQNWNLTAVSLSDGDKMYIKSDDTIPISESNSIYKNFVMTGSIAANGNIMSLLNFSDTLTQYAFYALFESINNSIVLTQAPELPATTLADNCYSYMFNTCASLVTAPALPATTLSRECYTAMFQGCTGLTAAPELPATTLPAYCYQSMFTGCSSLTTAPALPATTLANGCYDTMFQNCTSLTQAPELPATTLFNSCYANMFRGCTSLVQAPELPATNLVDYCYLGMFQSCSNLNYVKAMFTDISAELCLSDWLKNVSATGTFDKNKDATWSNTDAGIPTGWTILVEGVVPPEPEPEKDYLCFTSTGDSTVTMQQNGTPNTSANKVIQYRLNNGQWQNWDLLAVSLHDGDKMYLKSDDTIPISESNSIYKNFYMNGSIAASGNIMSLVNFSDTLTDYAFCELFKYCTKLTAAPALPATTLAEGCYREMFKGCTSLTTAPELPATTLNGYCYVHMFNGCKSLTTAPELPATTLPISCYAYMFNGCTSLTTAPELPATTFEQECYSGMFGGCTSLTQAPDLPATTLPLYCYKYMFQDCTSLTTAPELPATVLTESCYKGMFQGCTKLNYVKAMFTDISAQECLYEWLTNVSPTGTFDKSKDATWTNEQAGIPSGWTILVEGVVPPEPYLCFTSTGDSTVVMKQVGDPTYITSGKTIKYKLNNGQWQYWNYLTPVTLADGDKMYLKSDDTIPISEEGSTFRRFVITGSIAASGNIMSLFNFSTTLPNYGLSHVFYDCTDLTAAPALPATTLGESCYKSMFESCTSLTQAPALPATTLANNCYENMFKDCTSLVNAPELPATTLAIWCYGYMFYNCSKLNYVKAMFTDVEIMSLESWLNGVSSTGTFVKNSAATWDNTSAGIPSGWTVQTARPDT